jgi:HD superfamily phosphohydrolase
LATTKIKCPVEGIVDLDRLPGVPAAKVRRLIDSPELQRLRKIKQLGFTERVYPGATHTRFAHSLGAFQGAQRTLFQLRRGGCDIPDDWLTATAFACLLHDLGHGPFSHTFESISRSTNSAAIS